MSRRKLRVLVADDEKIIRETMRDYLPWGEMDMEVPVCVENGELALDYLIHHEVDIFIMDIRMPILDGMAVLREITERKMKVLVIVLSAYDQFEYAQQAIRCRQVFEYVLKPINRRELCQLLKKAAVRIISERRDAGFCETREQLEQLRWEFVVSLDEYGPETALKKVQSCVEQNYGNTEELEEFKRFLTSIYTEIQMALNRKGISSGSFLEDYNALSVLNACSGVDMLWREFCLLTDEIVPYFMGKEREEKERTKTSAVIRQCVNEIQEHFMEADFSLYQLADRMQLNANYLSSRFKKEMGVGFVRYVNQLRVNKAKQLLKDMRYRTNEVAVLVGFENPRYFTRIFKEMTGLVPSEYRSRIKVFTNESQRNPSVGP